MVMQIGLQQSILTVVERGEALHRGQTTDPLICQIAIGRMRRMARSAGCGVEIAAVVPDLRNVWIEPVVVDPHRETALEPGQLGSRVLDTWLSRDLRHRRCTECRLQYSLSF